MQNLNMKSSLILTLLFASPVVAATPAATCSYEIDPHTVQVNWTAFKTTQKLAVNGAFTEVTLYGGKGSKPTLGGLLDGLEAQIDVNQKEKVHTGNPARDQTLFEHFFSLFKKKAVMKGAIEKVSGNDVKGEFFLNLSMNQKTLPVPMSFTRDEKTEVLSARGSIDVNDFGLATALADLHHTCEALHTGPDHVSKTWPTVEIVLAAKIIKKCK